MFGFKRSNRLLKRGDFLRVQQKGRRIHGVLFSAHYLKSEREFLRLGLVTTTKLSKRAHIRNRCKRWVRESFRKHLQASKLTGDIVIIVKDKMIGATYHEVEEAVKSLLIK